MKFLIILAALAAANAWEDVAALSCKNGKADLADGQEVTIETPNYPENYPNKAKCNWKIKVPANEEVHIWCETFDLLKGDFLRVVGATSKLYGSFPNGFGEILPASSAERTLKFQFQSNKKKNAGGFRCQIVALAPNTGSGSGLTTAGSGSSVPGTCQCGIKGGAANSRIVGGQETEENEYPWQVALVSTWNSHYPWCGGTLISSTHVLTAAHCVYEKESSDIQVLLREHNTADSVIKTADVAEIINHPDWDRPTIDNDYAILRLSASGHCSHICRSTCYCNRMGQTRNRKQQVSNPARGRLDGDNEERLQQRLERLRRTGLEHHGQYDLYCRHRKKHLHRSLQPKATSL